MKALCFRSKAKWAIEGEKNTKYFMNLEKARYNAKTCHTLLIDGKTVNDPEKVLEAQRGFYEALYTRDQNISFQLGNNVTEYVDPESIACQEEPISVEEITEAMNGLKHNSCPGSDGLPVEFYKCFWSEVRDLLMAAYETVYRK